MNIDDKRVMWGIKKLALGDVFEHNGSIYIKIADRGINAFNLTYNEPKYFDDNAFVVKLDCELIIKG